jgi:hypothetical protein
MPYLSSKTVYHTLRSRHFHVDVDLLSRVKVKAVELLQVYVTIKKFKCYLCILSFFFVRLLNNIAFTRER